MNQITPGMSVSGQIDHSGSQPPRNSTANNPESMITFMYSPRKKSRNGVDEYSTMKPATSSDSASSRSKGGRLVSASVEMKNTTNIGKSGRKYQLNKPKRPSCAATISLKFSEPAQSSTVMMTKPIETS